MTESKDRLQQQKVLDTFFEDGKLKQLPVKHFKRVIVLEHILKVLSLEGFTRKKRSMASLSDTMVTTAPFDVRWWTGA